MPGEDQTESSSDPGGLVRAEDQTESSGDQGGAVHDEEQAESSSDQDGLVREDEQAESLADQDGPARDEEQAKPPRGRVFSVYGIASTVLGIVSVAAIVLGAVIWSAHRDDVSERDYQSRVMRAATGWASVLINMNTENIAASLQRLHGKTVGQLNVDFDTVIQPYRDLQKVQPHSSGRIESVAIESVHHDPDAQPGGQPGTQPGAPPRTSAQQKPPAAASRTDTVLVIASSFAENPAAPGKPKPVHWNLSLDVSDVHGNLLISRLSSIR